MHFFHRSLVASLLAIVSLVACGGGSAPAPGGSGPAGGGIGGSGNGRGGTPTAAPGDGSPPAVPSAGSIYLGAYVDPLTSGSDAANIAQFEGQIGRRLALSMHYRGWAKPFPTSDERTDAALGRIPVISWDCGTTDALVASGAQDATIAARADDLRAFGSPVFLRYKWEMDLPGGVRGRPQCADPARDTKGFFSPPAFVAAWTHIRAIFAAHGATNVAFLWNPSGGSDANPGPYYPGDAAVDWVGLDQYDWSDVPFVRTFSAYAQVAVYGKPILIAETGAHPAEQSAFLAAAATGLHTSFPSVKGLIYFDAPGNFDWELTPQGVAAFATMAGDPYFGAGTVAR